MDPQIMITAPPHTPQQAQNFQKHFAAYVVNDDRGKGISKCNSGIYKYYMPCRWHVKVVLKKLAK